MSQSFDKDIEIEVTFIKYHFISTYTLCVFRRVYHGLYRWKQFSGKEITIFVLIKSSSVELISVMIELLHIL